MPTVAHSIAQTVALAVAVAGLYLITSLGWAMVVGGSVVFLASMLTELGRPHPKAAAEPAVDRGQVV